MQGGFADGRFWDEGGSAWDRADVMVEPSRVVDLLKAGTPWLVEVCGSQPSPAAPEVLERTIVPHLAGTKDYQRMIRKKKKTVRTMYVAEEWQDEAGRSMLIFVEGSPGPRVHNWFY